MQYQGVEKIQKNGSAAVVTIKDFDSELDKQFFSRACYAAAC
mgnify:CR=1 FL=1